MLYTQGVPKIGDGISLISLCRSSKPPLILDFKVSQFFFFWYCYVTQSVYTYSPHCAHFGSWKKLHGTVLMIQLMRNSPTCAYIGQHLRKWKPHFSVRRGLGVNKNTIQCLETSAVNFIWDSCLHCGLTQTEKWNLLISWQLSQNAF